MLSPSVNASMSLLTRGFNEVLQLDNYALSTGNLQVGKLPIDPAWLASVRSRVALLGQAGASWTRDKPEIWGSILLQFADYASAFAGVARLQQQPGITTAAQWIELLNTVLLAQLDKAVSATDAASQAIITHRNAFSAIQPLLEQSINEGWVELASEEQQMVRIAAELQRLQDLVNALQDSVTSSDISSGQSVILTTVKTLYNIATEAGGSFSFLGMAGSAVTVGKYFYDIIHTSSEVADTLQKIAALQVLATEEAQAAAGTKMVLQLLYNLELSFASIGDVMPQIVTLWQTERDKVQNAISALSAGADPANYFDLLTFPTANANWQSLARFATAIPTRIDQAGPPVTLDPQQATLTAA